MKQKPNFIRKNKCLGFFIRSTRGNALPLVLMLVMVIMLVGGSVAYSTMQIYNITRDGYHDQLAYIAAENVLEKSIINLKNQITASGYPASHGVYFNGNADNFLNALITAINSDSAILNSYTVKVHDTLNEADVSVDFQRYGSGYTYNGSTLTFSIQIEATADMVDESYSSYGKKAVAVREFTIPVYTRFTLNGAVYTLGDLLVTSGNSIASDYTDSTPSENYSTIQGDVFVFGTGLDKTNRMQQYYTGGVCSTSNSVLHVKGDIFTRNLVRAGIFDDSDSGKSSIIVNGDIVAQGIQVFGSNDNIIVGGDAYTFDDIEMNGPNSIIAINGNFFGLNPGDGKVHDNSSAILNVSPMYLSAAEYWKSRIAVNGNIFANGVTFRLNNDEAVHKIESVSMTWRKDGPTGPYKPLYNYAGIDPVSEKGLIAQGKYDNVLMDDSPDEKNGFSVLWKVNWNYDNTAPFNTTNWHLWDNWVQEINSTPDATDPVKNNGITAKLPAAIEMQGFCNYGIAANNTFYKFNKDSEINSQVKGASPFTIKVVNKVPGLDSSDEHMLDLYDNSDPDKWSIYTDTMGASGSISSEMSKLMGYLKPFVQVFSQKEINLDGTFDYQYKPATSDPTAKTEFNRLKIALDNFAADSPNLTYERCIVRYNDDGVEGSPSVPTYLNTELEAVDMNNDNAIGDLDTTDDYKMYYILVVNLDPDNEIRITDDFYGIIFSLGRVVIEETGNVFGAIIAAGKGFDDKSVGDGGTGVAGSSADVYDTDKTRLPRVVISDDPSVVNTISNFTNWDYVAVELKNGGDIYYTDNVDLLTQFKNNVNIDYGTGVTDRKLNLFSIFNVEEP